MWPFWGENSSFVLPFFSLIVTEVSGQRMGLAGHGGDEKVLVFGHRVWEEARSLGMSGEV